DVVALRPREGESCGESKAVVLNLGIQIERLADAMEKQDVTGIGALASRMNMAAVKHGLDEVAETAGKLEAAVVADSDLAILVGLTNDLMAICHSAQQAYLDPTERLQAGTTAAVT
ncbi:MAG: hypothetical protein QGH33_16770, partial [Pirellulaceae bacterium]|nr:hypothetical protein [Pirellulaceae bacterium]